MKNFPYGQCHHGCTPSGDPYIPCKHNAITGWCHGQKNHALCQNNGGHIEGVGTTLPPSDRRPCLCNCHTKPTDAEMIAVSIKVVNLFHYLKLKGSDQ